MSAFWAHAWHIGFGRYGGHQRVVSVPCLLSTHTYKHVHAYTCTWGSCKCRCWRAHEARASQVTHARTQHARGHTLSTAMHTRVPVSILTSGLLQCIQVPWGRWHSCVCWFADVCSPWHTSWLMHRLCSPFLAVAVVTNGLKLGSGEGAASFFLYIYV